MSSWFRVTPESEATLAQERLVIAATEAIYEGMERAGVTQQQLADKLGVSPSEISQRLSGRRNLTLKRFAEMLHALGVRAKLAIESETAPYVAGVEWIEWDTTIATSTNPYLVQNFLVVGQDQLMTTCRGLPEVTTGPILDWQQFMSGPGSSLGIADQIQSVLVPVIDYGEVEAAFSAIFPIEDDDQHYSKGDPAASSSVGLPT